MLGHVSHAENFGCFRGKRGRAVQADLHSATKIFRVSRLTEKFIDVAKDVRGRGKG
jgi:hypothetical protein